jgi:hypothetical protein
MTTLSRISAALPLLALCACGERISAPEAVELVDALEKSTSPVAGPSGFWEAMGYSPRVNPSRLHGTSTVVLRRDGRSLAYRAVVIERVMVPASGVDTTGCAGTRWNLLLWRDADPPDGLSFGAGRFDLPLARGPRNCPGIRLVGPDPWLQLIDADVSTGIATEGEGEVSPGAVAGECRFLAADAAGMMNDEYSITCALTRHTARFRFRVERFSRAIPGAGPPHAQGSTDIELSPTEVLGIRYTIHCDDRERILRFCASPIVPDPEPHRKPQ